MPGTAELIQRLDEIADLLDLQGERFKPNAYRRAARSLEALGEEVAAVSARHELDQIPGVGAAIAAKIDEFLSTGQIEYLDKLRREVPPGLRELLQLPGVGPKTVRMLHLTLGIEGPQELAAAIEAGKLKGLAGFKERKIELLRGGLAALGASEGQRRPLLEAWELAERLVARLRSGAPVDQIVVAGSLRRRRESVGDLDILATSGAPAQVFRVFAAFPDIQAVRGQGETKMTVVIAPGIQVDLRVVPPESFGAALQYFTGSKDHNVRIRSLARELGLKVNEYGVYRGGTLIAGRTEEEVYTALHLPFFPPEIRENRGEIEAAEAGKLPTLVPAAAVFSDLHVDFRALEAWGNLGEWKASAVAAGLKELGIIWPEGKSGSEARALRTQWDDNGMERAPIRLRLGIERAAGTAGPLSDPFDFGIAVPPRRGGVATPPKPNPGPPSVTPWTVSGLRTSSSTAEKADPINEWIRWAVATGTALEVTPSPERDGLDSGAVKAAIAAGARLAITSRADRPEDLRHLAVATGIARRGWATPGDLLSGSLPPPPRAPRRPRN
jgi:DNA polymerase (family 10)